MKYTIVKDLVPMFEQKMQRYAKKFAKNGSYTYLKSKSYVCEDKTDFRYGYWLVDLDVEAYYKIGNYSFVAALEWIEEAEENLIKKASESIYVPEIYKTRRECDHCKTNRKRKSTILLQNSDSGEYIQVGKTCVKDYIGYDLGNYANYLSFFSDLEDYLLSCERENIKRFRPQYRVIEILEQTFSDVKLHGYISKAKAIENDCDSTAYRICSMFFEVRDINTGNLAYPRYHTLSADISDNISELIAFYNNYENDEKNDYIDNIRTILKTDWVESNNISLVVSAVGTMLRIKAEEEARKELKKSEFVGNIGEKITFKGKANCIYSADGAYGYFYIYRFNINGNELIWKTTKRIDTDAEFNFTATVKSHEEYKGVKQTEITRAKIVAQNRY